MNRTANASTLGYAAFALTLWMVSMIHAGWFAPSERSIDLMLAVTLGGSAMGLAGILEYFRGRTADMLLFLGFGAFWWAWALNLHAVSGAPRRPPAGYQARYCVVWAVLAFDIWFADFHEGGGEIAVHARTVVVAAGARAGRLDPSPLVHDPWRLPWPGDIRDRHVHRVCRRDQ